MLPVGQKKGENMSFSFHGGVHPRANKHMTANSPICNVSTPQEVYVPIVQHIGAPATVLVTVGQQVAKGQMLASAESFVCSPVFSPICGTVKAIEKRKSVSGKNVDHVVITKGEGDEEILLPKLENPTPAQILARIREAGIVGMGGAGFPVDVKLTPPAGATVDTLLINGAECEPYLTCDYRILLERAEDFICGVKYLAEAIGASKVVIAIEDNKIDVIEVLAKREDVVLVNGKGKKNKATAAQKEGNLIQLVTLRTKYPQGAEKQLIYAAIGRVVPEGGLPSSVGVIVNNVQTALATCYAVRDGKPLYERVVTVSGKAVGKPGNYLLPTGMTYADVATLCEVDKEKLAEIISGGPMMGKAVYSLDLVVTKTTSGILFLTADEVSRANPEPCIGCGRCVKSCPMGLMPLFIDKAALGKDEQTAEKYGALACIACGACSYVCPAKRPLVQSIQMIKAKIAGRKKQ